LPTTFEFPTSLCDEITVLILTYNEAPNIARTLEKLRWAPQVLVLDSFSTDETVAIARQFPNVEVRQRRFDSFARQCNFGLDLIRSEWVLSLDADYVLSDGLIEEIRELQESEDVWGYTASFKYCVFGKPLRASLYPPRTVLYRRNCARYQDDGHGHRIVINGRAQMLSGWIGHDDRKSLDRWFSEQVRYSIAESKKLSAAEPHTLNAADRLRQWIVAAPFVVFFYTLLVKGLIFDGWRGWYYVLQRTLAEILLSLRLVESKF
jgi:glycosyltransferase involved in cell wall biosynthesis